MKASKISLPFSYRLLNGFCRLLMTVRLPAFRLDEKSLIKEAIRQTGLTDFGDPYYREGLLSLLDSLEHDANLHPLGRLMAREIITNYLAQRLRLTESRKIEPQIYKSPLNPPLIITGPARSGTTFLHNLLALDSNHQALPQWLLLRPFPEDRGKKERRDPRVLKAEKALKFRQPLLSGLDSIHFNRADTFEECILALGITFHSLIFSTLLPVKGYMEWYLNKENKVLKYKEYGWLLHLFQSQAPGKNLTLKAPEHLGNLGQILEAVPGAMIIQTNRDPVMCISSVASLLYTFYSAVSTHINLQEITHLILEFYEHSFRQNLAFRSENPSIICDVPYDNLVSNPLETVHGIYDHFGLPWTREYESDLKQYILDHPKNALGKHRYSAEDFGLTNRGIAEKLSFYSNALGY